MRVRCFLLSPFLFFAAALSLTPLTVFAMGGTEGTFEYAIDAPWRIEPVFDAKTGKATYGAIPIQITIDDENVIPFDSFSINGNHIVATNRKIGNFCDLAIAHANVTRHIGLSGLSEIEMTGNASTDWKTGSWVKGQADPPHTTCKPAVESCTALQSPHGTSEWVAMAWYVPDISVNFVAGADVMLTLTAKFTRDPEIACTSTNAKDFLTLKNYVSIHAGEAPLPRFNDNRWIYGDLHFHGQGTDNEGEAGYNYRSAIRAMGAMGLDFVLAVEHASDSVQILDLDIFQSATDLITRSGEVLRDMDAERFKFLLDQLWRQDGVNKTTALDGRDSNGAVALPQNVLGHGVAPQIFLGGEVDAMPEIEAKYASTTPIGYGEFSFGGTGYFGSPTYQLTNLCGGWEDQITVCPHEQTVQLDWGVSILKDVQGYNTLHPARVHMVYMPRDSANPDGFVSSRTGVYGGGSRHLTVGNDGVFPEMENNGGLQKGYTFLAHPIPEGSCGGEKPSMSGSPGPDVIPYSGMMYDQAFRSKAVLGLEFWNEDIRMENSANDGTVREMGFESASDNTTFGIRNDEPKGFVMGKFEMYPWVRFPEPSYERACTRMEWMLHFGAHQWDELLVRGLVPNETSALAWLPAGEPRRLYMAGGSDAHGDLNYHRAGYTLGLESTDDMGIGKPRNLVMAGAPDVVLPWRGIPGQPGRREVHTHSHAQVLNALINGAFAVTDGPALRIAIDRNGNGIIDDADIPMGGIVEMYGEKTLPLLVEWDSTPEWGIVEQVDIVIGAVSSTDSEPYSAGNVTLYAPPANGARSHGTPAGGFVSVRVTADAREIHKREDGYTDDPTGGLLRFHPMSYAGTQKISIPLALLDLGGQANGTTTVMIPDRLFIRAFARSQQRDRSDVCVPDPKSGVCLFRYAYTNPVWAISPSRSSGECPKDRPRAIDSDGDGLPDGCDPCPRGNSASCGAQSVGIR